VDYALIAALCCPDREYGAASVLRLENVPVPTPGDSEVLVRIHVCPRARACAGVCGVCTCMCGSWSAGCARPLA
jgi:hypothetical protein